MFFLFLSCESGKKRDRVDVSSIELDETVVHRYGQEIFSLDTADLQNELIGIQPDFPVFLDGDLNDQGTLNRMKEFVSDPELILLNRDCQRIYPELTELEQEMDGLFKHLKYYYPNAEVPAVYSYVSGLDFEFQVQYYNNNLLIALDMYLGSDYPAYQKMGVPLYVIRRYDSKYISRDCAYQMGKSTINHRNLGKHLLDLMINEGKLLWFVKAMNPDLDNAVLFDYSESQIRWTQEFEGMVWAFIIENEVLYSSDPDYKKKFMMEAPFTSYFGNDSPPRLGAFIGYQMIDHYMQQNVDVSLSDLMQEYDSRKILKLSKYKPDY